MAVGGVIIVSDDDVGVLDSGSSFIGGPREDLKDLARALGAQPWQGSKLVSAPN